MAIACDPKALLAAAKCISCLTPKQRRAAALAALCSGAQSGKFPSGGGGGGGGSIPAPSAFTWVISPIGTLTTATWSAASPSGVTTTEVWTSADGVTFALAASVAVPTNFTNLASPAVGSFLYAKVRWCNGATCGPFSAALEVSGRVADWVARVIINGGSAGLTTRTTANTFDLALVAAGLDSLMLSVIAMGTDSLATFFTPLYKVIGTDPWTNHNFVGGDLTVNGLIGDGATKFVDMGFTCTQLQAASASNYGFCAYHFTGNDLFEVSIGVQNGVVLYDLQTFTDTKTYADMSFATGNGRISAVNSAWTGYLLASRRSQVDMALYKASSTVAHVQLGTNVNNIAPENLGNTFWGWGENNAGALAAPVTKRISFMAIPKGLTQAQSLSFFNAIQAMLVARGGGFA